MYLFKNWCFWVASSDAASVRLATQRLQLLGTFCTRQGLALALTEQQTHTLSVRLATADAECHAYMLPLECCRAVAKHTMSLNV